MRESMASPSAQLMASPSAERMAARNSAFHLHLHFHLHFHTSRKREMYRASDVLALAHEGRAQCRYPIGCESVSGGAEIAVSLLRSSTADAIDKCHSSPGRGLSSVTRQSPRCASLPGDAQRSAAVGDRSRGVLQLRRTGGVFFPRRSGTKLPTSSSSPRRTRETLQLPPTGPPDYEHPECRDTGWRELLDRDGKVVCIPCGCRATNSNYRRLTASSRK